jgi:fructan beta-fructosidase
MALSYKQGETYRPQFHYTPEANWMNDPNGMVYYEGEYHLFYQYHPDGTVWGPMHWGHAVSQDLVHWEQLPIALAPDEHGYIFSGSAVVDWNDTSGLFNGGTGLIAIFTHHDTDPATGDVRQRQSIAYSKDRGRTWVKYVGNPVLSEPMPDFRDPKVFWHAYTASWVMVIVAGDHLRIYRSPNLIDWKFASSFGLQDGSHDGVWECPDMFELPVEGEALEKRWVLVISIGDNEAYPEGSRTQYFVGGFDGYAFANENRPEQVLWVDYGRDNYAGVTWSDIPGSDGRRLFIGWMSNWKYANLTPTAGWRSAMTIPRELALYRAEAGIRLKQRPIRELRGLRKEPIRWRDLQLADDAPLKLKLPTDTFELRAEFSIGSAEQIRLTFAGSKGDAVIVGYDANSSKLILDRSASGKVDFHPQFGCRHDGPLEPDGDRVVLHLYLDRSSIEVFGGDGETVMTDLLFPNSALEGIEILSVGGMAKLMALDVHELRSIHAGAEAGSRRHA